MKNRSSKKSKNHNKKKKFFKKSPQKVTEKPIFPSISRFIPEIKLAKPHSKVAHDRRSAGSRFKNIVWNKYFLVSFISMFIATGIVLQGVELSQHFSKLQQIRNEREQVRGEILYWENVVGAHDNYRDGYFKLALLEYRLGNRKKSREYIDKTLFIDPNYEAALEFQKKIEER